MARLTYLQNQVHVALQEAQIKGYFTTSDLSTVQQSIASKLGYPTTEVFVTGTTHPQTRGNEITLMASVPSKLTFLNLSGGSNVLMLRASESAMSEALQ